VSTPNVGNDLALHPILSAFDALTPEQQSLALDTMRDRQNERTSRSRELDVVGGYTQRFEDESGTKRPLQPEHIKLIRNLKNRTEIEAYLKSLPDIELIHNYLHIQYRLTDGSLWQATAVAQIRRDVGGWNSITDVDVVPFDHT
jgi:hypothetical protein